MDIEARYRHANNAILNPIKYFDFCQYYFDYHTTGERYSANTSPHFGGSDSGIAWRKQTS